VTTASLGVQVLAAIAGVYPLQIVPRLVQLCSLLAGNTFSEDVESDAGGSERDDVEEDAKMTTDDSEDEDEESESTTHKAEYRFNLLLLVW
jgi:hypothetical protein